MKSHFRINRGTAMICAAAGAATLLNGRCGAQVAADYATNSIYTGGWSEGQTGGYGFGPWSFNDSDPGITPGTLQSMSTASTLGTAWTLMNTDSGSGISNTGRPILESGGLQVGQTFQTIIQNPVNNAGIYTYRGFDILFTSRDINDPAGDNTAALRLSVFDYFNAAMKWAITDSANEPRTSLSAMTTGASGMIIDFTLISTNTYALNMAPVSSPDSPYLTFSGTLETNLPINYINYRLWNTASTGPTDTADNLEISSMTIQGMMLNLQQAGTNAVLSWSTNVPNFVLAASPTLNSGAVWTTNLPAPAVVGNQNFVTNPISGPQQFYRLQLVQ
jgi:hypothetical protein